MSHDDPHASRAKPPQQDLPQPKIEITPAKDGIPSAGGDLDLLVGISVALPEVDVDRKPLNLALVIDRSGSMAGKPLDAAKASAEIAVGMLLPGDWVSIVAYDSNSQVLVPTEQVSEDRRAIVTKLRAIHPGSATALYAGWADGLTQAMTCPDADAISRVMLLSDGLANVGPQEPSEIVADVARAAGLGVSTTTLGLGIHFDEELLRGIADAGSGNYTFIENPEQMAEVFQRELAGLSALRGRNVRLSVVDGDGVRLGHVVQGLGDDARGLRLPDMIAGLPTEVLVRATFDDGGGPLTLAVSWDDAITGHRQTRSQELLLDVVDMSIFRALPVNPHVATMLIVAEAATLKSKLAEAARRGDTAGADALVAALTSVIDTLPEGEERTREHGEAERIRREVAMKNFAMASRYSEKVSRDASRGLDDKKRAYMAAEQGDWRAAKAAHAAEHAAKSAAGPASTGFVGRASQNPTGRSAAPSSGRAGTPPTNGATSPGHATVPAPTPTSRRSIGGQVLHETTFGQPMGSTVVVQLVRGTIIDQPVDAIVNSTNRGLFGSSGVDGAIHRLAGPELRAATRAIGSVQFGAAVFTPGFRLPARYVIHTATPAWGTSGDELSTLDRCYRASLTLADDLGARSVAFPALGTGHHGYPSSEAAKVAIESVRQWLAKLGDFRLIRFVVFDDANEQAYRDALGV